MENIVEKIVAIKDYEVYSSMQSVSGFQVVTNKQVIKLYIDNHQQCCEDWGYFWCNDDPQDFVGAELLEVKLTDDALNEAHMEQNDVYPKSKSFRGGVMFVNLETSKGTLQFVAYNDHNGYYSHEAAVESLQIVNAEYL